MATPDNPHMIIAEPDLPEPVSTVTVKAPEDPRPEPPDMKTIAENLIREFKARRFWLVRDEDVSGVSGTGYVAQGVMFPTYICVLHWLVKVHSTTVYASLDDLVEIHGHNGATRVEWIDPPYWWDLAEESAPAAPSESFQAQMGGSGGE